MNKTKVILSATGGTIVVAVLVMAYFVWSSYSAKVAAAEGDPDEGTDGLAQIVEKADALSRKKPYPSNESVREIVSNREAVVAWREGAFARASRGDRPVVPTTDAAFKEFIVGDAKRIASLPGGNGPIAADDFDFGPFKPYISEGKMPSREELPVLQRRWDDFATIAETLSSCGAVRITAIAFKTAQKVAEQEEAPKRQSRPARGGRKPQKAAAQESGEQKLSVQTYAITFLTRAPAFVKILNALGTSERFVVVDDFSFARETDVVAAALGADEKKEASPQPGRRRRGRRGQEPEPSQAESAQGKNGIVTDPLLDPPLSVTMTVSVYDFRSMEESKEVEK
jgi:hypothetical protein